jgi:hypothetical protein
MNRAAKQGGGAHSAPLCVLLSLKRRVRAAEREAKTHYTSIVDSNYIVFDLITYQPYTNLLLWSFHRELLKVLPYS